MEASLTYFLGSMCQVTRDGESAFKSWGREFYEITSSCRMNFERLWSSPGSFSLNDPFSFLRCELQTDLGLKGERLPVDELRLFAGQ
jgi:hypothetical protein